MNRKIRPQTSFAVVRDRKMIAVATGCLTMFLFVAIGCGGGSNTEVKPHTEWVTFDSPDGTFSVAFPNDSFETRATGDQLAAVSWYGEGFTYLSIQIYKAADDLTPPEGVTLRDSFVSAFNSLPLEGGIKPDNLDVVVDGHQGFGSGFQDLKKEYRQELWFVVGDQMLQLTVNIPATDLWHGHRKRFVESLRLTGPVRIPPAADGK